VEHLLDEELVALVGPGHDLPAAPVPLAVIAALPLVLPPERNPLRIELESAAANAGLTLRVPLEVEGIRLIADMVAAGDFASILPETAVPPELGTLRAVPIANMPPRRLAIVNARDTQLSLADRAVRDSVERLVEQRVARRAARGRGGVRRAAARRGPRA